MTIWIWSSLTWLLRKNVKLFSNSFLHLPLKVKTIFAILHENISNNRLLKNLRFGTFYTWFILGSQNVARITQTNFRSWLEQSHAWNDISCIISHFETWKSFFCKVFCCLFGLNRKTKHFFKANWNRHIKSNSNQIISF